MFKASDLSRTEFRWCLIPKSFQRLRFSSRRRKFEFIPDSRGLSTRTPINDVALIRVSGTVPLDITPAELLGRDMEPQLLRDGSSGMVLGWGRNASSRFAQHSNYLEMLTLDFISNGTCNGRNFYSGLIDDNVFCAASAVQPRRWVVERFFAWSGRNRRLAKDFEATLESAEAFLYGASSCCSPDGGAGNPPSRRSRCRRRPSR